MVGWIGECNQDSGFECCWLAAPVQHVSQEGQLDSLRFLKAINPEKFADGVRQKPTPLAKMMGSP